MGRLMGQKAAKEAAKEVVKEEQKLLKKRKAENELTDEDRQLARQALVLQEREILLKEEQFEMQKRDADLARIARLKEVLGNDDPLVKAEIEMFRKKLTKDLL